MALVASCMASCGATPASKMLGTPEYAPADQTKCGVEKSQANPLIVEWPSADRLQLENKVREGLVAVHYQGCEMRVLPRCNIGAKYRYLGGTRKQDSVEIRDEDDLYATLPVGAARLEGKLARSGKLTVAMDMVGRYEAERASLRLDDLQGDCEGATHFVYGVTVGAFDFYAGGEASVGGGVNVAGVGGGGHSTSERETLTRDGDQAACTKSSSADPSPPDNCGALIRLEVVPLTRPAPATPPASVPEPAAANVGVRTPATPITTPTATPTQEAPSSVSAPNAPLPTLSFGTASPDPPAPTPSISFSSPQRDQVIPAGSAADFPVKLRVTNWATTLGGAHLHLILDARPYKPIYDPNQPLKLSELTSGEALAPGQHILVAFPGRPNHESVKTPGAVAVVQFWIDQKGAVSQDVRRPMLVYSRPKGEYKAAMANHVLVDFQLLNDRLSVGGDHVHVMVTGPGIPGAGLTADAVQLGPPMFLENLPDGTYTVRLDLLGPDGGVLPGAWNSVTRVISVAH